ncbi:hypothetical protein GmHk_05G012714 [Glycine max]|nr:hypothetical protein GmHk_05G012714 [Glycine max]
MVAHIRDPRVDPSQYRDLVYYWCSKKGHKISNINKRNHSKYEDLHCMGRVHKIDKAPNILLIGQMIYIQKLKDLKKEDECVVLASFHIKKVHLKALMQTIELKNWRICLETLLLSLKCDLQKIHKLIKYLQMVLLVNIIKLQTIPTRGL